MKHFGKYISIRNQLNQDLLEIKEVHLDSLPILFQKFAKFLKSFHNLLTSHYESIEPTWISAFSEKIDVLHDQNDENNKSHYDKRIAEMIVDLRAEFYLNHNENEINLLMIKQLDEIVKEAVHLSQLEFDTPQTLHFESLKETLHSASINIFFEKISKVPVVKQQYGEILHQSAYDFLKYISQNFYLDDRNNINTYVLSIFTHARSSLKTQKRVNSIIDFLETACIHSEEDFLNVEYYQQESNFFIPMRQKILKQEHIATEIKALTRKGWSAEKLLDLKHYDSDFWNNTIVQSVIHYDTHALRRIEDELKSLYSNFSEDVDNWLLNLEEKFQSLKSYIKNPGKFHELYEKKQQTIHQYQEKMVHLLKLRIRLVNRQEIKTGQKLFLSDKALHKGPELIDTYNIIVQKGIHQHSSIIELSMLCDTAYNFFKKTMIDNLKELQKINKQLVHLKLKIIESNSKKKIHIKELEKDLEYPYLLTLVACIIFSISLAGIGIYKFKVLPSMFLGFVGMCIGLYKNFKITDKIAEIKAKKFY